mgnify:FL=1
MEDPQIESEDPASVARRISLNALARRAYSTGELKRLLEKKLVPSEIIHELIVKLTRSGLLNDSEYARAFRDSRIRTKGLSARLIARELQERGIDSELIQEVVDEIAHLDFPDAAIVAAAKKLRSTQDSRKARDRAISLLARRGYSLSQAVKIVELASK